MNTDQFEQEMKGFCEYAKRHPRVLIAGGATAVVLLSVGAPKVLALVAGSMVAGMIYSNSKRMIMRAH